MKIAVIGAGAMGSLFGGYLSKQHDVVLVDANPAIADAIVKNGLRVKEPDGSETVFRPNAVADSRNLGQMDVVILFVKALFSEAALEQHKSLIGSETALLTLQNGAGHEELLGRYVSADRLIIGVTQQGSALREPGVIFHTGAGATYLGSSGDGAGRAQDIASAFTECGLQTGVSDDIQRIVWRKLFTNTSASVLTGILQLKLGQVLAIPSAYSLCKTLIAEAVAVANALGLGFDENEIITEVTQVLENSPEGITSICADLRDGRKTEVDTISGAVVRAARKTGVPSPSHAMAVQLVHAMEQKHTL